MPRGIPKKRTEAKNAKETKRQETQGDVLKVPSLVPETKPEPKVETKPEPRRWVEPASPSLEDHIKESRKVLEQPIQPGQRLFETPEGEILVGQDDKTQMWSKRMNNGKGGWANPRR